MKTASVAGVFHTRWETMGADALFEAWHALGGMAAAEKEGGAAWGAAAIRLLAATCKDYGFAGRLTARQAADAAVFLAEKLAAPFYHFPTPSARAGRARLLAPSPRLASATLSQLAHADTWFYRFLKGQPGALANLAACLYLPKKEAFDPAAALARAGALAAAMPPRRAAAAAIAFGNCRSLMAEKHPRLHGGGGDGGDPGKGWKKTLYGLAGTAAFRGMATAKNANAWEGLGYLEYLHKTTSTNGNAIDQPR